MTLTKARVPLVRNPHYKKSGIKSYVWLLRKYNFNPTKEGPYFCGPLVHSQGKYGAGGLHELGEGHSGPAIGGRVHIQQKVLQKRVGTSGQAGDVPSEDQQNDSMYLSPVQIGTPAQTLYLDFDTGSSDLWVWSTELPKSTQQQGSRANHAIFDPSKSSTFKKTSGSTWKIQYGDQSTASGDVGTDVVQLGGLKIQNQGIELAKSISAQFINSAGSGLLGLAWGNINTVKPTPVKTPVENLISQGAVPKNEALFTAYLGSWRDADEDDKGQSFYTFGYVDQDVLKAANNAQPYYVPVDNTQGFWQFKSESVSINGKSIARSGNTAIADTGTTLALVDDATVEAIYKAIPGAKYDSTNQGYIFPTKTTEAQLPDVAFAVGDKLFHVQKEDLGFADAGNGFVYGGIQSRGDLNFDILGDTWLKGIYAIFDEGNERFGAVQRIEKHQNLSAPPQ